MAHFAKFISLARTPEELKKDAQKNAAPASVSVASDQPIYPYGLCVSFDEETIKKLELETEDCEVGAKIHLCCMAEVTDYSIRKTNDGPQRRIELQITDIAFENEDAESGTAFGNSERMEKRYGIKTGREDD